MNMAEQYCGGVGVGSGFPYFVGKGHGNSICSSDVKHEEIRSFLLQAVARMFEIESAQLLSLTRGNASIARARQVLMYLAHVGCGLSLTAVGRLFERDRTTVAHACQVVEDCREDDAFDRAVELLENIIGMMFGNSDRRRAV